jgi:hypothetical protein
MPILLDRGQHRPMVRSANSEDHPQLLTERATRRLRGLRLGTAGRKALHDGRLLVITPFGDEVTRTTAAQAVQRNELVAAMADAVLVPYASPGGKAEVTAKNVLARGQPLFTFSGEGNARLIEAGARCYELGRVMAGRSA